MTEQEQKTISTLNAVRKMLCDLLETESKDKWMRIRLTVSLKMVDAMISARDAQKHISNRIKSARNQKSR